MHGSKTTTQSKHTLQLHIDRSLACPNISITNTYTSYSVWRGIKRLVGNRANIFLENAVVMYCMSKYYKEYCTWIIEDARAWTSSSLHTRIVPKLRHPKMMAAMRARAIMFLQVSQPLRVACKSAGYVDGRAPSQLDIAPNSVVSTSRRSRPHDRGSEYVALMAHTMYSTGYPLNWLSRSIDIEPIPG